MRISTSMMHQTAVTSMLQRQAELSNTQQELSSGLRVQKPSDDPVAAVKLLQLNQAQAANTQYGTNITAATTRLNMEEQALSDTQSVMDRVHTLTVEANSSTTSSTDRQSIATELTQLSQQLTDIANRKDANGDYLFAGMSSATKPFVLNGSGNTTYVGDAGTRNVQIGAAQVVQDGDSGSNVFMAAAAGNGTFTLDGTSTNTGTGIISGSVQNSSNWVPGNYTLTFTSPTDWQITDNSLPATDPPVTSGTNYVAGSAITFNGAQVAVSGAPAAGDSFSINQSGSEDVFTTLKSLIGALSSPQDTPASQAQFQNQISKALTQLDSTETHFSNIRTTIGTRLSMLDSVESTREDSAVQIKSSIVDVGGADPVATMSLFSQQTIALQAAQQSYVKIAQLSLFSYL